MDSSFKIELDKIVNCILESQNIYLASHVQPDGDNIGSLLSLGLGLKKINKNVFILRADIIPADYLFLPSIELIKDYDNKEIDTLIVLDSGDEDRLGKNRDLLSKAKTVINIDHHISNTKFGHLNLIDDKASSTAELVYEVLKALNISIDKDMATCIYTGISTDTGSFIYDSTGAKAHLIAAELIEIGIDKKNININLYQNRSLERSKLFIKALEKLEFYFDNKIALVKVTQEMLKETNTTMEDTEGIVSFIRDISTVEIAVLLKEMDSNTIKVSMRSKRYANVSDICAYFGGGGHIRAAGCTLNSSIKEAEDSLIDRINQDLGD